MTRQDTLKEINDSLKLITTRMDTLDDTIKTEINKLQTTLSAEITEIKDANKVLSDLSNENFKIMNDHFVTYEKNNVAQLKKNAKLAKCIESLNDKLHRLETSVFSSQQHSRKYNVVLDGIPAEVGDSYLASAAIEII